VYLLCLHVILIFLTYRSLQNNADDSDADKLEKLEKLLTHALRNTKSKKVDKNGSVDTFNQLLYQGIRFWLLLGPCAVSKKCSVFVHFH
jgi:hypothetical protein